jgi:hypothetical protein
MTALDHTFTAPLVGDMGPHRWVCVILEDSRRILGAATAVKVRATVDGVTVETSMLPHKGRHMLALKKPVLDAIGKTAGDEVTIHLTSP